MPLKPHHQFLLNTAPRFVRSETHSIRSLSGFKKAHRVPLQLNAATGKFIGKLVADELHDEFQYVHRILRNSFGLKRKDIEITIEEDGAAILESTLFRLEKRYSTTPDALDQVHCETSLDDITDLNLLANQSFESEFPFRFYAMEVQSNLKLDIEKLIDYIEDHPEFQQHLQLDYPFDASQCQIRDPDLNSSMIIAEDNLMLSAESNRSGSELIKDYACYLQVLDGFIGN